jgi:rhomboid protease GluP
MLDDLSPQNSEWELRLKKTLLSEKPKSSALGVVAVFVGALVILNALYWQGLLGSSIESNHSLVFANHEWWRLLSSPWIHADFHHLGSNVFLFSIFGFLLNSYYGSNLFPLLGIVIAPVIQAITLIFYHENVYLIGASGVVYWMAGAWLTLYVLTERANKLRLNSAIAFTLIVLGPSTFEPNTSYLAHAVGFVLGIITGYCFGRLNQDTIRSHDVYQWEEVISPSTRQNEEIRPSTPLQ